MGTPCSPHARTTAATSSPVGRANDEPRLAAESSGQIVLEAGAQLRVRKHVIGPDELHEALGQPLADLHPAHRSTRSPRETGCAAPYVL